MKCSLRLKPSVSEIMNDPFSFAWTATEEKAIFILINRVNPENIFPTSQRNKWSEIRDSLIERYKPLSPRDSVGQTICDKIEEVYKELLEQTGPTAKILRVPNPDSSSGSRDDFSTAGVLAAMENHRAAKKVNKGREADNGVVSLNAFHRKHQIPNQVEAVISPHPEISDKNYAEMSIDELNTHQRTLKKSTETPLGIYISSQKLGNSDRNISDIFARFKRIYQSKTDAELITEVERLNNDQQFTNKVKVDNAAYSQANALFMEIVHERMRMVVEEIERKK